MDDLLDFLKLFGIAAILLVLAFGLAMIPISILDRTSCNAKTAEIGFAHRWEFWGGCWIEITPGQWIPLDNYFVNQEK